MRPRSLFRCIRVASPGSTSPASSASVGVGRKASRRSAVGGRPVRRTYPPHQRRVGAACMDSEAQTLLSIAARMKRSIGVMCPRAATDGGGGSVVGGGFGGRAKSRSGGACAGRGRLGAGPCAAPGAACAPGWRRRVFVGRSWLLLPGWHACRRRLNRTAGSCFSRVGHGWPCRSRAAADSPALLVAHPSRRGCVPPPWTSHARSTPMERLDVRRSKNRGAAADAVGGQTVLGRGRPYGCSGGSPIAIQCGSAASHYGISAVGRGASRKGAAPGRAMFAPSLFSLLGRPSPSRVRRRKLAGFAHDFR